MENYIRIDIDTNSTAEQEILIAELSETFEAFEQEKNVLHAFIKEENFNEQLLENNSFNYSKSVIPKVNWNSKWESEFEPVIINDFACVRANFHQPIKSVKHDIIITPKMSFGTGHHATTYLMLQEMESIDFENKQVLDFGTGTGILSIMASRLGAKKIVAIDNDEWSIENAKENILLNSCNNIEVQLKNSIEDFDTFDIILVNINLHIIISNLERLKNISHRSSILLLSGFLKSDENIIADKISSSGFFIESIKQQQEWICVKVFL